MEGYSKSLFLNLFVIEPFIPWNTHLKKQSLGNNDYPDYPDYPDIEHKQFD